MATISVWGDSFEIRTVGRFEKFPERQWYLLNAGDSETIIVVPCTFGLGEAQWLVDEFGTTFGRALIDTEYHYFIPVGTRDDDAIITLLNKM